MKVFGNKRIIDGKTETGNEVTLKKFVSMLGNEGFTAMPSGNIWQYEIPAREGQDRIVILEPKNSSKS